MRVDGVLCIRGPVVRILLAPVYIHVVPVERLEPWPRGCRRGRGRVHRATHHWVLIYRGLGVGVNTAGIDTDVDIGGCSERTGLVMTMVLW